MITYLLQLILLNYPPKFYPLDSWAYYITSNNLFSDLMLHHDYSTKLVQDRISKILNCYLFWLIRQILEELLITTNNTTY